MDVCTVISRSEWAKARALARSVRDHHPSARFTVLLLDSDAAEAPEDGVEIAALEDLELGDAGLLPALLDREQLREAIAPVLLRRALSRGAEVALFAHPETRLYGPLDAFVEHAIEGGLAVTPVLAAPVPNDGARPNREALEGWGAFDPGLIAASRDGRVLKMLDFWAQGATALPKVSSDDASVYVSWWYDFESTELALRDTVRPPSARVWLDLATGLVPGFAVNRDPGCNVAYWNLHGRRFEANGDGFTVDGVPLRSFQFRAFDPSRPRLLSPEQSRISLADEPGLRLICERYSEELIALGDEEARRIPYGFERLPGGTELDARMRKLAREAVARGAVTNPVFSEFGERQFLSWLREPAFAGAPPEFNRYMLQIYKERGDLQRGIPPSDPDFAARIVEWVRVSGPREERIPDPVRPHPIEEASTDGAGDAPSPRARRRAIPAVSLAGPSDTWGVNVVGFMRSDFGLAQAGRLAIDALDMARVPLVPIHDLSLARFKTEGSGFATLGTGAAGFPVSLLAMNGDLLNRFRREVPPSFFEERYTIAMWFWETGRIPPDWESSLEVLDEIWAASDFVGQAASRSTPLPVTKVGLPVSVPTVAPADRAELGVGEDDFLFLYMFDFGSGAARKNPLGVVEAFKRAFQPGAGAKLLLKSSYSIYAEHDIVELRLAAAAHPDILIDDGRVATERKNAILAACDCYVSLHRSEGFGLSQAEAMYLGKPLICTGYGGVLEFASDENSYLVDYELTEIGESQGPYRASDHWADPDLDHAAELMRRTFSERDEARERGARGAAEVRSAHSAEAVGKRMDERLTRIRRLLRSEIAATGAPPPAPAEDPISASAADPSPTPTENPGPTPTQDPSPDPTEAPAPATIWARLRARVRLRTRLRGVLRWIIGARDPGPPDQAEAEAEAEARARAEALARAEAEAKAEARARAEAEEVWRREQELRLAALSAQLLEQTRRLDRAIGRLASGERGDR